MTADNAEKIQIAANGLLSASMVIMVALGFSVKTLMVFLKNGLTNVKMSFRIQDFIDLLMGVMVCVSIIFTFTLGKETKNLNAKENTFANRLFTTFLVVAESKNPDLFAFAIILNFVLWVRLFMAMSLTELAGPTMQIMIEMTK